MFRSIDQSPRLAKLIEWLSGFLAKRRGLLVIIGVFLVILSFGISLLNLYARWQLLDVLWVITHHSGIIIAFIGYLLVEPLGK